ncbi:hypothetical protein [Fretibacter rubidus]|uniref:hypothetical protein n=1 Tax=Fretibacter rubidus TaxID=570162 RepID=UPI00352BA067
MTHFITKIAIAAAITIGATSTAQASDTFTARFDYDATASAADNLQSFSATAKTVCADQMAAEGFRPTEGRFQRRKCERNLLKQAVKATRNDALSLVYAENTRKAPRSKTPSTLLAQN